MVEPLGQFLELAHGNQFAEVSIYRVAQTSEILPPIDMACLQRTSQVRSSAPKG